MNKSTSSAPQDRSTQPVSADIDRLLSSKSLQELNTLDTQVSMKLQSDEPIDVEYWEQLQGRIGVYKARAELHQVYKSIIESRLTDLRMQQAAEAKNVKERLALLVSNSAESPKLLCESSRPAESYSNPLLQSVQYSRSLDPEPSLKLRPEEKVHEMFEESDFLDKLVSTTSPLTGSSFHSSIGSRKGQDSQTELCPSTTI